jgi:hypothetical protein
MIRSDTLKHGPQDGEIYGPLSGLGSPNLDPAACTGGKDGCMVHEMALHFLPAPLLLPSCIA